MNNGRPDPVEVQKLHDYVKWLIEQERQSQDKQVLARYARSRCATILKDERLTDREALRCVNREIKQYGLA